MKYLKCILVLMFIMTITLVSNNKVEAGEIHYTDRKVIKQIKNGKYNFNGIVIGKKLEVYSSNFKGYYGNSHANFGQSKYSKKQIDEIFIPKYGIAYSDFQEKLAFKDKKITRIVAYPPVDKTYKKELIRKLYGQPIFKGRTRSPQGTYYTVDFYRNVIFIYQDNYPGNIDNSGINKDTLSFVMMQKTKSNKELKKWMTQVKKECIPDSVRSFEW